MIKVFFCLFFFSFNCYADSNQLKQMDIKTERGIVSYQVEIADTFSKREKGLMNRKFLPEGQGMLFVFSKAETIYMWMKNTYIPLDMLFINDNDIIVHIYQNAIPQSTHLISSVYPISKVLEINAGQVQKNQIKTGQKISFN